ncbi:MAG: CBS domain-containing protein [Candidatus Eremiobacterota bacterium]
MKRSVFSVEPMMLVNELAPLLLEKGFSGAPVVESDGSLVGVVSLEDLAAHAYGEETDQRPPFFSAPWMDELGDDIKLDQLEAAVTVRDIMSPTVYQVKEQTPLVELVELMLGARIRRAVVTDQGRVVGIVTSSDILRLVPRLLRENPTLLNSSR